MLKDFSPLRRDCLQVRGGVGIKVPTFFSGGFGPRLFLSRAPPKRSLTVPNATRSGIAGPSSHSIWLSGRWPAIPNSRTSCTARARQDAKRAKLFTKLIREITTAARLGSADPAANPRLRAADDRGARGQHAKDTIDRAIKRGAGGEADANYDEVRYEGYGPGGVAVIVEALTDNRNRTAGEVRSTFSKHGGTLGETNSVVVHVRPHGRDPLSGQGRQAPTTMFEAAIEAGADDVESGDGEEARTRSSARQEDFSAVREALEKPFGAARGGQADLAAADHDAGRRRDGGDAAQADRRAGRQRRRPERLRQFRGRPTTTLWRSSRPETRDRDAPDRPRSRPAAHRLGRDRRRGQPAAPCRRRRRQCPTQPAAGRAAGASSIDGLAAVIERAAPDEAAVEETFVNRTRPRP